MKRPIHFLFAISSAIILIALTGCRGAGEGYSLEQALPTMHIQGKGLAEAIPDISTAVFGVRSDDKLLTKAYKDNTKKMNAAINVIKEAGIEERDIRTSSYSVTPIYPKDEKGRTVPGKPASYRVAQELTVKIQDIDSTGKVIDEVMSAGVNTFSGLSFTSSRIEELEQEARILAAEDARKRAGSLAESMGVELGRIIRLGHSTMRPQPEMRMMSYDTSSASTIPQVEAGTMEIRATCEVIYEIIQ